MVLPALFSILGVTLTNWVSTPRESLHLARIAVPSTLASGPTYTPVQALHTRAFANSSTATSAEVSILTLIYYISSSPYLDTSALLQTDYHNKGKKDTGSQL